MKKKMINKIPKWIIETLIWYGVLVVFLSLFVVDFYNSIIIVTLLCLFGWGLMIVYPFFDSLLYYLWRKEQSEYLTKKYFIITIIGLIMIIGSVFFYKILYING